MAGTRGIDGVLQIKDPIFGQKIVFQAKNYTSNHDQLAIVKAFEDVADDWCVETEKLLAENDNARAESDDEARAQEEAEALRRSGFVVVARAEELGAVVERLHQPAREFAPCPCTTIQTHPTHLDVTLGL